MRTRSSILAPLLSCLLALPANVLAAPAEGEEGAQGESAEAPAEPEIDEAKLEEAKVLYGKAEKLAKKKKWKEAEALYEQAYYLVPGKHGFAHKVGVAAHKAKDCEKAVEYMVHFLQYALDEKFEDRRAEAREILKASLERGCTTEEELNNLHLDPEELEEKARELYQQAEEFAAAEQWADAAMTYEQAYYLVPYKVGFAEKVGMAAYRLGDCDMAHEYLVHFVEYADPGKYSDKMAESTNIILELERSGCVSDQEMEEHHFENPFDIDPDSRRGGDDGRKKRGSSNKAMLYGGVGAAVLGLAGLGVGVAGFALAGGPQSTLDTLASTDTPSGLPAGDYSCRDVAEDQCPPVLEVQIRNRRLMGGVGVGIGTGLLVAGGALIALSFVLGGDEQAEEGSLARVEAIGPMLLPGGGGAAASIRF